MNLKIFKFWFCRIVKRLILYIILSVFNTTLSMVKIRPLWIMWKNRFWKLKSENSNTSENSQDQLIFLPSWYIRDCCEKTTHPAFYEDMKFEKKTKNWRNCSFYFSMRFQNVIKGLMNFIHSQKHELSCKLFCAIYSFANICFAFFIYININDEYFLPSKNNSKNNYLRMQLQNRARIT